MAKRSMPVRIAAGAVRTRRAYFDCQYGQLHVHTAFPTTGGFDEQVTLICIHAGGASGRAFGRFLPAIATERSAYAPDLPGCGESDPAPSSSAADSARAVADLAADLRLRQVDLLGFGDGAAVAVELALAKPELVRRVCLIAPAAYERATLVRQPCLALRIGGATSGSAALPPEAQVMEAPEYAADLFEAAPQTLAQQLIPFLNRKP